MKRIEAKFEARQNKDEAWVWEVWDISHPNESNHFSILTVDSKGAAEDFHEELARDIAAFLNLQKRSFYL
jgi:hypothetical protein